MSWKPCRSSGITFDKHKTKADKYKNLISEMFEDNKYLRFENLKQFSKYIYLYWLNENKAYQCFGKGERYSLKSCCFYTSVYNMLETHKDKIYKPMQNAFDKIN